jgi:hypothetical protein
MIYLEENRKYNYYTDTDMKLILILVSLLLLVYGSITSNLIPNIIGAGAFILLLVVDLIENIITIKRRWISPQNNGLHETLKDKLTDILAPIVTVAGLVGICVGQTLEGEDVWSLPGGIIFGGALLFYLVNGWVMRAMTGVPLRMGYGGWYVARSKRRRSRSLHSKSYNKYVGRR